MATFSGNYTEHDRDGYTEYEVHSGRLLVTLQEGDVLENIHFNYTASGAYATVVDAPSWNDTPLQNFTIRNVAFDGEFPSVESVAMSIACTGTATVENVYLGDGTSSYPHGGSNWNGYSGGIIARPPHTGHLTFRGVNVQNWVDNGMYLSPPGHPGPGVGRFTVENCFARHNQISCYRLGTDDTLRNCYAELQSGDHRCLWVYNTSSADVDVEGCHLDASAGGTAIVVGSGGTARVSNSRWTEETRAGTFIDQGGNSRNPEYFEPAGCPMTAEEAYQGEPGQRDHTVDALDPLDPVSSGSYANSVVARNTDPAEGSELNLWFDTTDESDVIRTDDYAPSHDSSEAWSIESDDEYGGLVRSGFFMWDEDGVDETARRAMRTNAPLVAVEVNPEHAASDPEITQEGDAQLEIDGEVIDSRDYPRTPADKAPEPGEPDLPRVETNTPSSVGEATVTLTGDVHTMGGYDAVECVFRMRQSGETEWALTHQVTVRETTGSFEETYPTDSGRGSDLLAPEGAYEAQAIIRDTDTGEVLDTGTRRSFQTRAPPPDPVPEDPSDVRVGSIWVVDAPTENLHED